MRRYSTDSSGERSVASTPSTPAPEAAAADEAPEAPGADESKEFWRQSQEFHREYVAVGNAADLLAIPQRDHYSLLSAWREPESAQFKMMMDHMNACINNGT